MCAIIPAYQAQETIQSLVEGIVAQGIRVIVLDDASSDATSIQASQAGARAIRLSPNSGKGVALSEGFALALKEGFRWILTLDADGQHLPSEIPRFLKAAQEGQGGFLIGNRMGNPKGMPLERRLINRLMSLILSWVAGQRIPDTQCGFRLISARVLQGLELTSQRFEIDSELVIKAAWSGVPIVSIPVSSVYRRSISFIRPIQDTIRFLRFLASLRHAKKR